MSPAAWARVRLTPRGLRCRSRRRAPGRSCPSRTRRARCRRSVRPRRGHRRDLLSVEIDPTSRAAEVQDVRGSAGHRRRTSAAMRTSMSACGSRLDVATESAVVSVRAGRGQGRRFCRMQPWWFPSVRGFSGQTPERERAVRNCPASIGLRPPVLLMPMA